MGHQRTRGAAHKLGGAVLAIHVVPQVTRRFSWRWPISTGSVLQCMGAVIQGASQHGLSSWNIADYPKPLRTSWRIDSGLRKPLLHRARLRNAWRAVVSQRTCNHDPINVPSKQGIIVARGLAARLWNHGRDRQKPTPMGLGRPRLCLLHCPSTLKPKLRSGPEGTSCGPWACGVERPSRRPWEGLFTQQSGNTDTRTKGRAGEERAALPQELCTCAGRLARSAHAWQSWRTRLLPGKPRKRSLRQSTRSEQRVGNDDDSGEERLGIGRHPGDGAGETVRRYSSGWVRAARDVVELCYPCVVQDRVTSRVRHRCVKGQMHLLSEGMKAPATEVL